MTVDDILEAAYAKSTKNNPGTIATESTELLQVVQRTLEGLFAVAARINPYHFAETVLTAATASTHWERPEGAESIFRIEESGSEVVVVPFYDKMAESAKPAVYEYGQAFFPAGNAGDPDPSTDSLDFYYSKAPEVLTATTDSLDPLWEEQFNELLIIEVSRYLAVKDSETEGRAAEVASLMSEREMWANRYVAFLEHATVGIRKRYGHFNRFNTQSLSPVLSLIGATTLGQTK